MNSDELRERTMAFAVEVFRFLEPLFDQPKTRNVASQLLRAATSVASNYRAATHARSPKEWRAKLGVVVEESDESVFWLAFIQRAVSPKSQVTNSRVADELTDEAQQLTRIFGAALGTSRRNARRTSEPT